MKRRSRRATQNSGTSLGRRGRGANLRPWKPGQSGNPGGRPRFAFFRDALRAELGRVVDGGVTVAEKIARKLGQRAMRGDVQAAKFLAERTEGTPSQVLNILGPGGHVIVQMVHHLARPKRGSAPGKPPGA